MLNLLSKFSTDIDDTEVTIISRMEEDYFGVNSYSYQELKFFQSNNNYELICILDENEIVGYAILFITEEQIEIYKIAVNKKFRNKGYGTNLINIIKQKFNNSKIFIEVSENNKAYYFYLKNGFIKYRSRSNYYPDGSDAYLMFFNPNV